MGLVALRLAKSRHVVLVIVFGPRQEKRQEGRTHCTIGGNHADSRSNLLVTSCLPHSIQLLLQGTQAYQTSRSSKCKGRGLAPSRSGSVSEEGQRWLA